MRNTRTARHEKDSRPSAQVFWGLAWPAITIYTIPLTALLILNRDSTSAPYFELNTWLALCAYFVTETGGTTGAPLVGLFMLVLLIARAGVFCRQRLIEAVIIFGFLLILGGGGAALNERVLKPAFKSPRPDIVYLSGDDGSGPLKMPASEFYALGREQRRMHLRTVLESEPPPLALHHPIREHWIATVGYSFPSGHAFIAAFLATYFLALGLTLTSVPRRNLFFLLLPWAVCVAYSRVVLWVHSPGDVIVGSCTGLLLGTLAFVFVRACLIRMIRKERAAI